MRPHNLILRTVRTACIMLLMAPAGLPGQSDAERLQAHLQRAQQALQSGDSDVAVQELEAVIALNPHHTEARANLGVMRFFQGEWKAAAKQFRKVLDQRPGLAKAQALLGLSERRLGQTEEARRLLQESVPRLAAGDLLTQAGMELLEIHYQAGELSRAVEALEKVRQTDPDNVDVLYTAYRIYTDLAYEARDALATIAPGSARMHQLIAQHLINTGELTAAIEHYRKALETDPSLRGVRVELGQAVLEQSSSSSALAEAEKLFREAVRRNPGNAQAVYLLGKVDAERGGFAAAAAHYEQALEIQPGHVDALIGLGEALMKQQKFSEAAGYLERAGELAPADANLHYRLAMAYRKLGRKEEAGEALARFRELEQTRKRIEQVYQEMNQRVRRSHALSSESKNP